MMLYHEKDNHIQYLYPAKVYHKQKERDHQMLGIFINCFCQLFYFF